MLTWRARCSALAPNRVQLDRRATPPPPPRRRVLIVEDDPDALDLYRETLVRDGWAVTTAKTVAEARQRVAHRTPDVVVLDWRLPDGNGTDLLSEWNQSMKSVPVLLVTAYAHAADDAHGATALLLKPCTPSSLVGLVEKLVDATRPTEPPPPSQTTPVKELLSCASSSCGALLYRLGHDRIQARCDKCLRASPIFFGTADDAAIHLAALDWGMDTDGRFKCNGCRQ